MNPNKTKKGFSIIEVLIASALVVIAFSSIFGVMAFFLKTARINKVSLEAESLLEATAEGVRGFRDNTEWSTDGLGTIELGVQYYPEKNLSSDWVLTSGEEAVDGFTRWVVFYGVERDSDGNIISDDNTTLGTFDTCKAVVSIEAEELGKTFTSSFYLTNWEQL